MKLAKYIGLFMLILPIVVFEFIKPAKILWPEIAGVECVKDWLCVDDIVKANEAKALYEEAKESVEQKLTSFSKNPKFIFCSSMACFSSFGFEKAAAKSIDGFGVVIGPRGWKKYYIKHELIHQWQSLNFGVVGTWLAPDWITEGMAYALSDDPRAVLHEPYQTYRAKYTKKYGGLSGLELKDKLEQDI
jgi:hypothetical protein